MSASPMQIAAMAVRECHGMVSPTACPARDRVIACRSSQPTKTVVAPPRARPAPVVRMACQLAVLRSCRGVAPSSASSSRLRERWAAPIRVALSRGLRALSSSEPAKAGAP